MAGEARQPVVWEPGQPHGVEPFMAPVEHAAALPVAIASPRLPAAVPGHNS